VVGIDSLNDYYPRDIKRTNLAPLLRHPQFSFLANDLLAMPIIPFVDTADAIFHLAGQPGVRHSWSAGFTDYVDRNLRLTQRLLEAAVNGGFSGQFVYASSSSVYGNLRDYPTHEEDTPHPESPYGVTKLAAEHLCSLYASTHGLRTCSLRFFTVYGPGQRPDMAFHRLCESLLTGSIFPVYGDGSQIRDFTHVDDVTKAVSMAGSASLPPGSVLNIAGGSSSSLLEVFAALEDLTGKTPLLDYRPRAAGDVQRTGASTDRAAELLQWQPQVSLRDGLRLQYDWHRSLRDYPG
jgi:UDP-glucuronate 4-epimerase